MQILDYCNFITLLKQQGKNVSFRIITNDTVGNVNDSASVKNFTIQINDTTLPTLRVTVTGHVHLNDTNTSDTTPTVFWNVTAERSGLRNMSIKIDSADNDDDQLCGRSQRFLTGASAGANSNGSMTVLDTGICTALTDGAHTVRFTAEDEWGNYQLYSHSFTVSTSTPTITLSSIGGGIGAVNNSNVSVYTNLTFTATDGTGGVMKSFSWTSSFNSAGETLSSSASDFPVANRSAIWPFNFSDCKGAEANRTVTVTVADTVGNSVTNLFQFAVDDLGPTIAVHSPTDNSRFTTGLVDVNISAFDGMSRIDTI